MKNKSELIAALTAAEITCDESMTVVQLQELATANNIPIKKEKPVVETPAELEPAAPSGDDELIAQKVRAGLRYEDAVEVIARQRAEDAANGR